MNRRVEHEPAYILHSYDWSESSLILEVLSKNHGRLAIVAKGVKRPLSSFRTTLLPLQFLHIGFSFAKNDESEIATLKSAEWAGASLMPSGANLLSGAYINELVLRMLAREDAHSELFADYHATVQSLANSSENETAKALRAFELMLLKATGHLPELGVDGLRQQSLQEHVLYTLHPQFGLRESSDKSENPLQGSEWLSLEQAFGNIDLLQLACGKINPSALRIQLRNMLNFQLNGNSLKTREFIAQIKQLQTV